MQCAMSGGGETAAGGGDKKWELPLQSAVMCTRRIPLIELPPDMWLYWQDQLRTTCRTLCALVHYYKRHRSKTQLRAAWKKKQKAANGASTVSSLPTSKLEKLAKSVRGRLVEAFSVDSVDPLLRAVVEVIEAHW